MTPRAPLQRRRRRIDHQAGFKEPFRQVVSSFVVCERRGFCEVSAVMNGISSAVDPWHLDTAPVGPTPRAVFSKLLRAVDMMMPRLWVSLPTAVTWSRSPNLCMVVRWYRASSGEARVALVEYQERMLRHPGDPALTESVSECTDPRLRCNRNE